MGNRAALSAAQHFRQSLDSSAIGMAAEMLSLARMLSSETLTSDLSMSSLDQERMPC